MVKVQRKIFNFLLLLCQSILIGSENNLLLNEQYTIRLSNGMKIFNRQDKIAKYLEQKACGDSIKKPYKNYSWISSIIIYIELIEVIGFIINPSFNYFMLF